MWQLFVIPFIIFFIIFLFVARGIFKTRNKFDEVKSKVEKLKELAPEIVEVFIPVQPAQSEESKPQYVECEYCGESVKEGHKECPSCGARLKMKK